MTKSKKTTNKKTKRPNYKKGKELKRSGAGYLKRREGLLSSDLERME